MEVTDYIEDGCRSELDGYGITDVQAAIAYAMVREGRPIAEILTEYGIEDEEFTAWVREGKFSEYAAALASGFAKADAPYIWNSLIYHAKKGNIQAIKLYFDIWNKKRAAKARAGEGFTTDCDIESLRTDIFGETE